jgi:hypothetical protein
VLSSGVSTIAQADVTKHAREMPIVRRIGIASHPSCWASPCRGTTDLAVPCQQYWMGEEMQIGVGPDYPR